MALDRVYGEQRALCGHCGRVIRRRRRARGPSPKYCAKCASPEGRAARHATKEAAQLGIPLFPLDRKGRTIDERYAEWRRTPHGQSVYKTFRHYAYVALDRCTKYSHKALVERVRWHHVIEERSPDGFKINDHYTSRMARELVEENGRFADLFDLRTLRTK